MDDKICGLYVHINSEKPKIMTESIYGVDNAIERALDVSVCSNVSYIDIVNTDENSIDCCVVYATVEDGTIKYLDNDILKEENK